MSIVATQINTFIDAAAKTIRDHENEITALDQAIGDGDHVYNLQRGLSALETLADELEGLDWAAALQKIGISVMSTIGGASGSLYATLFIALSKALRDKEMNLANFAEAFNLSVDAVKQRGKADAGDKTMLDVLIPVAAVLVDAAQKKLTLTETLQRVEQAAETGCESTREMIASRGRAAFLGERSRGTLDPGACSAMFMIAAIAQVLSVADSSV
jgi:phosphoenolpyruvate---glycerone phosphotransferase subunit DhaL